MQTLTDFFDRIFVINLPDRKDRYRAIRRELAKFGMPLAHPNVSVFPATRYHESCGFPSPSVRGCFLSHLSVLKLARSLKLQNVLVIEDDLSMSPLLSEHLAGLMSRVKREPWGFLYFGHVEQLPSSCTPAMIPFTRPLPTAHFYAVHSSIFDRLIGYLEEVQVRAPGDPSGGPMHYDGALSMFRQRNPDVLTFIAQPALGWQRSSRSDIHSRWFDRIPGLRQAAAITRSARGNLAGRYPAILASHRQKVLDSTPKAPEPQNQGGSTEPEPKRTVNIFR